MKYLPVRIHCHLLESVQHRWTGGHKLNTDTPVWLTNFQEPVSGSAFWTIMLINYFPDMNNCQTLASADDPFTNDEPSKAWQKTACIIRRINPEYDFTLVQSVFDDIMRLFLGTYPGYNAIRTPYHDLSHTLDVFMCGVRLMHGVHISGDPLEKEEITSLMVALLMHDVGYAQRQSEENGTGAQHTGTHVPRGIEFMRKYFIEHNLPSTIAIHTSRMILGTEHSRPFDWIDFRNERERMLASIVATADIAGQMAGRLYLEKLLFLYLEFKEANLGNYRSMFDLLNQTNHFYVMTREKLDESLGGIYNKLEFHFRDMMGVGKNYYLESIEKNIAYLSRIVAQDETVMFSMLRRNGAVERSLALERIDSIFQK